MIEQSGSLENTKRLEVLYRNHHDWLISVAYNLCFSQEVAQDLVQELYIYLGEKQNHNLWYLDSFNLKYCHSFLSSRWINLIKRENKNVYPSRWKDTLDDEYDEEFDIEIDKSYEQLQDELKRLEGTNMWASAKIFSMYSFGTQSMEELSDEIGISKSTTFLNVKKIKQHLRKTINNPFDESKQCKRPRKDEGKSSL